MANPTTTTNAKQFNALSKRALAFGLSQTKKQFKKITVEESEEVDGVIVSAKFRLEVTDAQGENRQYINVKLEQGEVRTRKPKATVIHQE